MDISATALIMMGYQNDFLLPSGALYSEVAESSSVEKLKNNTVELVNLVYELPLPILFTPMSFSRNFQELPARVGFANTIRGKNALLRDSFGEETSVELTQFGQRIVEMKGKRNYNALNHTKVLDFIADQNIENIVLAGLYTSICIDSTARAASDLGLNVVVLSDCTLSRTVFEQKFYCEHILPLYAQVMDKYQFVHELQMAA
ncbi:MAG: cysteine hydrolase [Gammaproteobacteria bacterium]|nr:cysteine hydrolase [Gammaproteobacteria bacterium]